MCWVVLLVCMYVPKVQLEVLLATCILHFCAKCCKLLHLCTCICTLKIMLECASVHHAIFNLKSIMCTIYKRSLCTYIYEGNQITSLLEDPYQQVCNLIPYIDVSSIVSYSESYCTLLQCGSPILGQIGLRFVKIFHRSCFHCGWDYTLWKGHSGLDCSWFAHACCGKPQYGKERFSPL